MKRDYRKERFLPCTREVSIGRGIVYRPIRSWHSGTYAGEGIDHVNSDRSGCVEVLNDREVTSPPSTATHRLYWNVRHPSVRVSAFLSYPGRMGVSDEYFWETEIASGFDSITRFFGDNAEVEMEVAITEELKDEPLVEVALDALEEP